MTYQPGPDFHSRFQYVVARMRITGVLTVLGWTALGLAATLVVFASIDYLFETNWIFRAAMLGVAGVATVCAAAALLLRSLPRWNRSATAAEVENRFQDLGQSVRTSVQIHEEGPRGVSPSLLRALNEDVDARTQELRLTEAVSTGPFRISVALLSLIVLLAIIACWSSWDWRMAASRTLLGNHPYTLVKVEQGNTRVDEKATFTLNTAITGRTDRKVTLLTRTLDGETQQWEPRPLTQKDETANETRLIGYEVKIPKVKKPFEYQVVAGKYNSPVHRVDVRYPLAIEAFNIHVTPPEYTGIQTKSIDKGSFEAVQGSKARFGIHLDHSPAKAWLELRPLVTPLGEEPMIETVPLRIDGVLLSADLDLEHDRLYQVFAEADDGTQLRPNRYRIRVHEDRPPKLSFQKPDQIIEVHSLAEVFMKLKVSDDYGLRNAKIVFQLNNDPEITLEEFDYEDIVTPDGKPTPRTNAMIESLIPLEYFEMTLKDSISFYASATDNRPGQPNMDETDLHFIDIRPFRQNYPVPEDGQGLRGMGRNNDSNRRDLPALNEMIGRERFVLNRTMQIQRQDERGKSIDANAIDNLLNVQNDTSEFAGLLGDEATGIEQQLGIPEEGRISDLLYAAQDSMLASVDSLASSEWDVAKLQEKDALQYLLDARTRLENATNNGRGGGGSAFRNASRRLMRRMRRPRNNQERAREIVRRLRRAAAEQEFLMEKMSDLVPPEMPAVENQDEPANENDQDPREEQFPDDDMESDDQGPSLDELRRDLEKEQSELSDDVQDIVDMIEELNQVSPLAQQRTQRAASNADGVIGALERGDSESAMNAAERASAAFRILADNIAGITADEATRRIEIARDLGMLLTDELRGLESEIAEANRSAEESDLDPTGMEQFETELARPLSRSAEQQAEIAKTIQDVLNSVVDPEQGINDQEDRMVKRLQEIMEENKLEESIGRLQAVPALIDSLAWSDARIQTGDLGDRFDIVSQRLDAIHREILAPRVEQLRVLEKRAVETKQALSGLQTDDQVNRWHLRADGLMEDIESAQVAVTQVEKVRETMEAAGWGAGGEDEWNWETNVGGTALAPPAQYDPSLSAVIGEIQRHIRELSMINMQISNSGAVPPKYKQFVERYFDLLSGASPDSEADAEDTEE